MALTNFGLLYPAADGRPGWEVVCDDNFGLAPPSRIRRAGDGRLFAASNEGLHVTADGCRFEVASGAIAGKIVYDVTFDARNPMRVWALGDLPRKLWISSDGGKAFACQQAFPDELTVSRLISAPSDPERLYLFGRGVQADHPDGRLHRRRQDLRHLRSHGRGQSGAAVGLRLAGDFADRSADRLLRRRSTATAISCGRPATAARPCAGC